MKNRFALLWGIWSFVGAVLIYGTSIADSKNNIASIIANVLSLSPIIGLLLALGSAKASRQFNDWLHKDKNSLFYVAGGISFLFILPGLVTCKFDPNYSVIFTAVVFAVFGVLKQTVNQEFTLFVWLQLQGWDMAGHTERVEIAYLLPFLYIHLSIGPGNYFLKGKVRNQIQQINEYEISIGSMQFFLALIS